MSSNSIGRAGEQLFQQIMTNKGYEVTNVSSNPEYYYKGDFIVESPFSHEKKIFEVKTDTVIHRTGNLYLELSNIHSKNGQGFFNFCQADYLAYCDWVTRLFYIIPLAELKERVKQLPQRITHCDLDSRGLLVSLNDIQDIVQQL